MTIATFCVLIEKKNAAIDSVAGKHLIRNNHILLEKKQDNLYHNNKY